MKKTGGVIKRTSIQPNKPKQINESNNLQGLSVQGTTTGISTQQQLQQQQIQKVQAKSGQGPIVKAKSQIQKGTNIKKPTGVVKNTNTFKPSTSTNNSKSKLEINNVKGVSTKKQNDQKQQLQQKTNENPQNKQKDEQKISENQEKLQQQQQLQSQLQKDEQKEEKQQENKQIEEQKQEDIIGEITLKYSHYVKQFKIKNGELSKIDIDEELYLSGVFQGNFQMVLKGEDDKQVQDSYKLSFKNLQDKKIYLLSIIEDEEAESKVEHKGYKASENQQNNGIKKNQRSEDLTNQLKGLTQEELKEKGEKYKQLIEARDLEDCLYT